MPCTNATPTATTQGLRQYRLAWVVGTTRRVVQVYATTMQHATQLAQQVDPDLWHGGTVRVTARCLGVTYHKGRGRSCRRWVDPRRLCCPGHAKQLPQG